MGDQLHRRLRFAGDGPADRLARVPRRGRMDPAHAPLLATGVLGGYTTFSTFSLETILLFERGETAAALAYVAAPEMVRKEVWTHLLAYNLVRTVMAQAAERHNLLPREISFEGGAANHERLEPDYLLIGRAGFPLWAETSLATIAQHRVADRPDRVEPRAVQRPKPHRLLTIPRHEARTRLLRTASA